MLSSSFEIQAEVCIVASVYCPNASRIGNNDLRRVFNIYRSITVFNIEARIQCKTEYLPTFVGDRYIAPHGM